MTKEEKIDAILGINKVDYPNIPVHLWVTGAKGKPGEPDFEEWMRICTQCVDAYHREHGRRDTDSVFAKFVQEYGRREYKNNLIK